MVQGAGREEGGVSAIPRPPRRSVCGAGRALEGAWGPRGPGPLRFEPRHRAVPWSHEGSGGPPGPAPVRTEVRAAPQGGQRAPPGLRLLPGATVRYRPARRSAEALGRGHSRGSSAEGGAEPSARFARRRACGRLRSGPGRRHLPRGRRTGSRGPAPASRPPAPARPAAAALPGPRAPGAHPVRELHRRGRTCAPSAQPPRQRFRGGRSLPPQRRPRPGGAKPQPAAAPPRGGVTAPAPPPEEPRTCAGSVPGRPRSACRPAPFRHKEGGVIPARKDHFSLHTQCSPHRKRTTFKSAKFLLKMCIFRVTMLTF